MNRYQPRISLASAARVRQNHVTRKSCPIDKPTPGFKPTFIAIDLGDRMD